jgi:hypothetical protein
MNILSMKPYGGERYIATEYAAFQISDDTGRTYEIEGLIAGSLDEAMTQAVTLRAFQHKDHLAIRETGERGVKVHLFAVKRKSTARYVHRDHVTRAVRDLYLAPVCTIDGGAIMDDEHPRERRSSNGSPSDAR